MNSELLKSKTFWTGLVAVITTVGSVFVGEITWAQAAMPILTALIGIFLKDALISQTKSLQG